MSKEDDQSHLRPAARTRKADLDGEGSRLRVRPHPKNARCPPKRSDSRRLTSLPPHADQADGHERKRKEQQGAWLGNGGCVGDRNVSVIRKRTPAQIRYPAQQELVVRARRIGQRSGESSSVMTPVIAVVNGQRATVSDDWVPIGAVGNIVLDVSIRRIEQAAVSYTAISCFEPLRGSTDSYRFRRSQLPDLTVRYCSFRLQRVTKVYHRICAGES
jgi:hypothetical protein